jgi:hypothetical protein
MAKQPAVREMFRFLHYNAGRSSSARESKSLYIRTASELTRRVRRPTSGSVEQPFSEHPVSQLAPKEKRRDRNQRSRKRYGDEYAAP